MLASNTAPIGAHPDTNYNAQHDTSVRFRCTCGHCAVCVSASVLPRIATPSEGEANPEPGLDGGASSHEVEGHQNANSRGVASIQAGAATRNVPSTTSAPTGSLHEHQGVAVGTRRYSALQERAFKPMSEAAMTAAVNKFERLAGEMPLEQVTPANVKEFVDGLRREGMRESVVLRYLLALKTATQLLGAFEHSDTVRTNPFAEAAKVLRPPAPSREQTPPISLENLQQLLSSPWYLATRHASEPHRAARFWVPLLCLFTGARPKELMRLQVQELERHRGAWVLRVASTMQADPRTGAPLMRWVPLHEELIRCGFVAYVAKHKLDGHGDLFSSGAEAESLGSRASMVNRWFLNLAQNLGLGRGYNLAALRHAFIVASTRSGVSGDCIRQMTGPTVVALPPRDKLASPLTHEEVLDRAIAEVARLQFEGLELSHLYAPEPQTGVTDTSQDGTHE